MADPMDVDTSQTSLQDLETVFYHDVYGLNSCLIRAWPTLSRWECREQGRTITGKLTGLNEMLIVLRRMYASNTSLLSSDMHQNTALLQLSCKDIESLKPDDPLLLKVVLEQLGRDLCIDKDPSFGTILRHDAMAGFWAAPSMRLTPSKYLHSKMGKSQWFLREWEDGENPWTDDLVTFQGTETIEQRLEKQFQISLLGAHEARLCCNFPEFLRVHYTPSDDNTSARFKDIHSFNLTAPKLSEDDLAKQPKDTREPKKPVDIKMETHHYRLIACVFERNSPDEQSEVRTYSSIGEALQPFAKWEGGWKKRVGESRANCFLFYIRCKPDIQPRIAEPEVNPGTEMFYKLDVMGFIRTRLGGDEKTSMPVRKPPICQWMHENLVPQPTSSSTSAVSTRDPRPMTAPSHKTSEDAQIAKSAKSSRLEHGATGQEQEGVEVAGTAKRPADYVVSSQHGLKRDHEPDDESNDWLGLREQVVPRNRHHDRAEFGVRRRELGDGETYGAQFCNIQTRDSGHSRGRPRGGGRGRGRGGDARPRGDSYRPSRS